MGNDNDQLLGEEFNKNNTDLGNQGSDQDPDYLNILVGDGKKYADNTNLAKGYANLAAHTQTVMDEKVELQAKYDAMVAQTKTVDDVLAAINGEHSQGSHNDNHQNDDPNANQGISKDDIASLISGALDKRDDDKEALAEVAKIEANQKATWDKLSKEYGDKDKAKAAITMYINGDQKKKELVQQLGSYDPDSLVQILKIAVPEKGEGVDFGLGDMGNQNHNENSPTPQGLFTYAEAEVVRKKNPKLYNGRDFQLRLHKSASEHPRFWEGTNRRKK